MRRGGISMLVIAVLVATASSNTGHGALAFERAADYGMDSTFMIEVGDFDGDGDLDAFFSNMQSESVIWMNQGDGTFRRGSQRFGGQAHGAGAGDLDNDGDLDLVITRASTSSATEVYLNDGAGFFRPAVALGDMGISGNYLSLFDLEGDGDLDIGIYYSTSRSSLVYVNDGGAGFQAMEQRFPGQASWNDLDGDGDADAMVEQAGGGFSPWFQQNDGSFLAGRTVAGAGPYLPSDAQLADLDKDGDLDYVCSSSVFGERGPLTVLINDGSGNFTTRDSGAFVAPAGRVRLADLDGDGVTDVLVSALWAGDWIGLGNGFGGFEESGLTFGENRLSGVPAVGDFNGDGRLDLFLAQYDPAGSNTVWLNTISE